MKFIEANTTQYIYLIFITVFFFLLRLIILKFIKNRISEKKNFRLYKIYINYIFLLVLIMFYIPILLPSLKEFITMLALFGAGVILVFKEIIINFFSFFYILIRKPFIIGDRIQVQNLYGDILDVRLLDFSIIQLYPQKYGGQSSGRVIHIPNSFAILYPVINFSKEFAFNWLEIQIPLTYKSNWQKAEKIIHKILKNILDKIEENDPKINFSRTEYNIHYSKLTPKTYVEFLNGAIIITIRFLCEPKKQRIFKDIFWREFLTSIKKSKDIHLHENYDNRIQF